MSNKEKLLELIKNQPQHFDIVDTEYGSYVQRTKESERWIREIKKLGYIIDEMNMVVHVNHD